jgi:protein ImuB
MYAALYLPSFRLQAALRLRSEGLPPGPAALVDGGEKKGLIMELNAAAQRAGIRPGLPVPRAMARCEKLSVVLRDPGAEDTAHTTLMQTAYALSPEVESTAPGLCTLRLRLPRNRDAGDEGRRAVALLEQVGLKGQAGLGPNPDLAFLAARRAKPVLVVTEPSAFLDALPVSVLRPPPDMVELLQDWGIHTLRQLRSLPRAELVDRLGAEAGKLWEQACGKSGRPLHLIDPPQEFVESLEFEEEVDTLAPLLFLLLRFLGHLTQRLRCMGRVAGSMTLTLKLEREGEYERFFSIPAPAADPDVLYRILFTHLESLRLENRVVALALRLDPVLPSRDQFHLFGTVLRDPNRLGETLGRLSALVGPENTGVCVRVNTHHPDAWRMETPQFQKLPAADVCMFPSLTGLPLRRYRPALPADVKMTDDLPEHLLCSVTRGAVVTALGPYVLSGQWWEAFVNPSSTDGPSEMKAAAATSPENDRAAASIHSRVAAQDNSRGVKPTVALSIESQPRSGERIPEETSASDDVVEQCRAFLPSLPSTTIDAGRWDSFAAARLTETMSGDRGLKPTAIIFRRCAAKTWTDNLAASSRLSSPPSPQKAPSSLAPRKELVLLEAAYEPGWVREEWDVELEDGALLRLARLPSGWTVEGYYELPAPAAESGFQPRIVS